MLGRSGRALLCDNVPELACTAMADWAGERVGLIFIPPGEPWRNGYIESFSGRLHGRSFEHQVVLVIGPRQVYISDWKTEYNHHRPHSALGCQAPAH